MSSLGAHVTLFVLSFGGSFSGLDVSLFDTNAFKDDGSICSRKLQDSGPNYFRYLQPLSEYLYVGAM